MRVITGSARGRRLTTLPGTDIVRPTSDKIKEAVFSSIQFDIEGRRVLDLFAGSGQMGIEALSRGAESAVFVDKSAAAIDIVKKNLEVCGFCDNARIVHSDFMSYLLRSSDIFDIVFLDPPYKSGLLADALRNTVSHLSNYGMVFCEHPSDIILPESVGEFSISRIFKFGGIFVTMYKKGAA
ncbi:MAG: 16S rRNA (guanine(966)-N(2))-methyltransferase RsmD [Clostridia bacterium]|nr:16S rRNA (guanine(966)-N(2))-methyltransferase RsmD [Clostridia bacterium]